jgi:hypothetical protein
MFMDASQRVNWVNFCLSVFYRRRNSKLCSPRFYDVITIFLNTMLNSIIKMKTFFCVLSMNRLL